MSEFDNQILVHYCPTIFSSIDWSPLKKLGYRKTRLAVTHIYNQGCNGRLTALFSCFGSDRVMIDCQSRNRFWQGKVSRNGKALMVQSLDEKNWGKETICVSVMQKLDIWRITGSEILMAPIKP